MRPEQTDPTDDQIPMPAQDSLAKRSVYKFLSNVIGLISNIVIQAIVPRALGPREFGNFNFLTSFFGQVTEFLDGRSSVGALVKISLRPNEPGLIVFYIYYALAATLVVFASIGAFIGLGWADDLWPLQSNGFILLASCWGLLAWYHGILHKICDAFGYTVEAERTRVVQKVLSIILILSMVVAKKITLSTFFIYYLAILIFLVFGFGQILVRNGKWPSLSDWMMPWKSMVSYAREYYVFSVPLLSYIAMESAVAMFDRWMLQSHSGSVEQGYFGLAYQVGYVSILFVVAMSPLIEREFSVSFAEEDKERINYLFHRYMPILFALASFFGAFVCIQADKFVDLFAGDQYESSERVIAILAFYPIYYTFGRVLSSVFFATGQNKAFRNIGLGVQILGIGLTWLLLAPSQYGGFSLGAAGLSIKLVIVYGLLVNIQLLYITRVLNLGFWQICLQQHLSLAMFLVLAVVTRWWTEAGFSDSSAFIQFIVGGSLYVLMAGVITMFSPYFTGLKQQDIMSALKYLRDAFTPRARLKKQRDDEDQVNLTFPQLEEQILKGQLKISILGAGSSIHTRRWVNSLAERGHDIDLITMHPPAADDYVHPSVKVHLLQIREPWGYVLNALKLRKILKTLKPNLFHVHYASGYGTLGTLSGYQPRIVSVWGHDIFNFPYESIYSRVLILLNLRTATWICSTSCVMAHQTVRILKSTADRISVTPFGVDLAFFKPQERVSDDIVVGTVKTLAPKYGIDVLIKGFAKARDRLKASHPDLADRMKLRIVGGGHWRDYLEKLAANCGAGEVTTFLGHISHEQVPVELNKLDIYVAMSREDSESFGVAIIEASACELPVVVSNAGGLKEVVIEGVTGSIIPQDDFKALADQLVNLVLDQGRRELYGKAGRSHVVDNYEWNKSLATMESVYALVMSRSETLR